jgi:hypothetical protein
MRDAQVRPGSYTSGFFERGFLPRFTSVSIGDTVSKSRLFPTD